jgi:hypothetical protein
VSTALTAALRAHAAGLYPDEAGTGLLIRHGGILLREDFSGFVHTGTSISDGATLLAWIDWDAALSALHRGQLPLSGGEQPILILAASIAAGTLACLRDPLPGLDSRNLELLVTAVRHAAGHHQTRPGRETSRAWSASTATHKSLLSDPQGPYRATGTAASSLGSGSIRA